MNLVMLITFIRSFTRGSLNDGSLPMLAPDCEFVCPSCGGIDVVDNGHFDHAQRGLLLTCQECLEIGSRFDFVETTVFGG